MGNTLPRSFAESVTSREFRLRVQSALLRSIAAVLRTGGAAGVTPEALHADLIAIDRELAQLGDGHRPMHALARRYGWSAQEVDFVWATIALAIDPRLMVHARALDPSATHGMSTSLYCRIAGADASHAQKIGIALLSDRSLVRTGLLAMAPGSWLPTSAPWIPSRELLDHVLDERDDRRLPNELAFVEAPAEVVLDTAQRDALDVLRSALTAHDVLLHVHGPEGSGRRTAIAHVSSQPTLALDLARIDASPAALDHALVGLFREASLRDTVAVIVNADELSSDDGRMRVLATRVEQACVPTVIVTTVASFDLRTSRATIRVGWTIPDVAARLALWREMTAQAPDSLAPLARRYRIGAGLISRAITSARAISRKGPLESVSTDDLDAGVRHNIAEKLAGLAERVHVEQAWRDCILPEDVETQVRALIGRARQAHIVYDQWGYRAKVPRGTGVTAMFSGPPGTGKTMVAGLIANELGLELYQVDLSKIVSKWIGETEKQLAKLFDAAEEGHIMLLFDEADSMFGQRSTEMKSATDRYANLEVNFLLQRIESFQGVAILTTNLDSSIDKAFKRRLAAHVVFQPPEESERVELWKRMITSDGAPLARDIDAVALARQFPKMTGANIRNAALSAAFLAAAKSRKAIDHSSLVAAARSEYLSMGHVLTHGAL